MMYNRDDPRFNLSFCHKEDADKLLTDPIEMVDFSKLDYDVYPIKKEKYDVNDKFIPLSVLSINDFDSARQFYKDKYSNLPEEYWDIMAKYHISGGQGWQKKQLKNEVKKLNKKGKSKEIGGLKIVRNKFLLDFN